MCIIIRGKVIKKKNKEFLFVVFIYGLKVYFREFIWYFYCVGSFSLVVIVLEELVLDFSLGFFF